MGQDAAALSGRLAADAILRSDQNGTRAIDEYEKLAARIVEQVRGNQKRAIAKFDTNEELQRHLYRGMPRVAALMVTQTLLNRVRPPEKMRLLPP